MSALATGGRVIPAEWIDYNGHMMDAYYFVAFTEATEAFLDHVGLGKAYREPSGCGMYTVESHLCFKASVRAGELIRYRSQLLGYDTKRLHVFHQMTMPNDTAAATNELMFLHVELAGERVTAMPSERMAALAVLAAAQAVLPLPEQAGRRIAMPVTNPAERRQVLVLRWKNLGEEPVVGTPWFKLNLAEVELPGGQRLQHYLMRMPPVVLVAVVDRHRRVLLLWRHRFIPDSWGWELPSGIAQPGESLPEAAAEQALNESGWEPTGLRPLMKLEPSSGLTDSVNQIYWTDQAIARGEPAAYFEAERIDWIPLDQVPELIAEGKIRAAATVAALLLLLHRQPT